MTAQERVYDLMTDAPEITPEIAAEVARLLRRHTPPNRAFIIGTALMFRKWKIEKAQAPDAAGDP